MEALDWIMLIFIASVAVVSAVGFFKTYKKKD